MSAGNVNWAFGDGGDGEDLSDSAEKYNYALQADNLWREVCLDCGGEGVYRAKYAHTGRPDGSSCEVCGGSGVVEDKGLTDQEMWQYIWDRRESEAEDMVLL